ncbi:UDP-N-acetylmuramoylalanine--D-glutamate ligase [Sesbania bispinosa]|nr:UDP-N-acetylmuramoylalanine--D-glutamate ligase [Sesbania bispinosa]
MKSISSPLEGWFGGGDDALRFSGMSNGTFLARDGPARVVGIGILASVETIPATEEVMAGMVVEVT